MVDLCYVLIYLVFMMISNSKLFVWNCRGAANTSFYRVCKHYVNIHKPIMLVILETRCDPNKLRCSFNLLGFDEFSATEVQGYAGGIACAWKSDDIYVDVCEKNFQYMHLKVRYPNDGWWFFTPVYASPNENARHALWEELKRLSVSMNEPWLVAGDFNDISNIEEKKGGVVASMRKCNTFRERINMRSLIDIGAMGPKFTWRGPVYHGGQRIFERLDRALCNSQWRLIYPDGCVKVLTRLDYSDHHPLLISPKEAPHLVAPKQFKFESAWMIDSNYSDMLRQSWNNEEAIVTNLANVERNIKVWRFQTIDQVIHQKKELMARIGGIQRHIQSGNNRVGLKRLEQRLQRELNDILRKEELMWYQRSRAKWLQDGDRNTRYYHLKTVSRRRRNNIIMLKNDSGLKVLNKFKI
jgi:hypothetical protein